MVDPCCLYDTYEDDHAGGGMVDMVLGGRGGMYMKSETRG